MLRPSASRMQVYRGENHRMARAGGSPYGSMALLYETRAYAGPLLLLSDARDSLYAIQGNRAFFFQRGAHWACLLEFLAESTPQNYITCFSVFSARTRPGVVWPA